MCAKVVAFCGDSLSGHALGGLQGSFSSGYICRFCYCSYGDVSNIFLEIQCLLRRVRTIESLYEDLDAAEQGRDSRGVKSRSVLYNTGYNDICLSTLLLPDCLRDFLKGVVPKVICVVLRTMKADKILTLPKINELISTFRYQLKDSGLNPYDMEITNANLSEAKLKDTASQKWCLLVHLPFILRDVQIPDTNQAWQLLIKCREIGEIILSDSIPKSKIPYLSCLIDEHHQLFRLLAPVAMTHKFHFLIHYPRLITLFGPPVRYWTMRFEAKHQYFKDLARKCKNFKNLPHTLSTRCQALQAVALSSYFFGLSEILCGPWNHISLRV